MTNVENAWPILSMPPWRVFFANQPSSMNRKLNLQPQSGQPDDSKRTADGCQFPAHRPEMITKLAHRIGRGSVLASRSSGCSI